MLLVLPPLLNTPVGDVSKPWMSQCVTKGTAFKKLICILSCVASPDVFDQKMQFLMFCELPPESRRTPPPKWLKSEEFAYSVEFVRVNDAEEKLLIPPPFRKEVLPMNAQLTTVVGPKTLTKAPPLPL
jgi:hypothetical protein